MSEFVNIAIKEAEPHLSTFVGGYPRHFVYDQNDPTQLLTDRSMCTGCAVGYAYRSLSGAHGNYARRFYSEAKKHPDNNPKNPGSSLKHVLQAALDYHRKTNDTHGGENFYMLNGLNAILSWVIVEGPVVFGCHMKEGMVYPTTKKWWQLLGHRWGHYTGHNVFKHAMVIVGFNAPGRYVVVQNSWGRSYGNKGRIRVSYDDIQAMIKDRSPFYGLTLKNTCLQGSSK